MKAYVTVIKDMEGLDLVKSVHLDQSVLSSIPLDFRVEIHEVQGNIPNDKEFNKLISKQAVEEYHFNLLQALESALVLKPHATAEEFINIVRYSV